MNMIIGYDLEKKRIEAIADVFKNLKKYQEKGIYIPKGLLLSGPAGVGKTLFAKYLAEISGVSFFPFTPSNSKNASLENANKIKQLFEEAKNHVPAIIFVDEIDNYLPTDFFHSDRNTDFQATLLKALDGEGYEGILFIGTCLRSDDLPYQLLRSGRIDEHIVLLRPDLQTRKKIIEYYLSKIDMVFDLDVKTLAFKTAGFVGADIQNLVNMSSRIALSTGKTKMVIDDFLESIYTIRFKDIKRPNNDSDYVRVAIHEIGHLIVGKFLLGKSFDITTDSYDYVKGITTMVQIDDESDDMNSQVEDSNFCISQITTALAGKVAEEMNFESSTFGCLSDIKKILDIIYNMAASGMFGFKYINLANEYDKSEWSEGLKKRLEIKTKNIIRKCYKKAKIILKTYQPLFAELLKILMDKTVLVAEESDTIFKKYDF